MRTTMFRALRLSLSAVRAQTMTGVFTLAVLLALAVPSAFAQGVVKGKVVDAEGKPVDGATITFETQGSASKRETKTDKKGEFMQIGLASGTWTITASKDGVGTATSQGRVSQGAPAEVQMKLAKAAGGFPGATGDAKAQAELRTLADEAAKEEQAQNWDGAIAKYNELIAKVPTCADCIRHVGDAQAAKKDYAAAEASYKQSLAVKESPEAYMGLAKIYNDQRKFDQAAEASTKMAALQSAGGAAGGGAEAQYNTGVALFNGGKFAEAKTAFEAATKADPTYAPAFYQLGMTALNLGQIPDAVNALETYLKVAPNGPKAAEVNASLPALKGMLPK